MNMLYRSETLLYYNKFLLWLKTFTFEYKTLTYFLKSSSIIYISKIQNNSDSHPQGDQLKKKNDNILSWEYCKAFLFN